MPNYRVKIFLIAFAFLITFPNFADNISFIDIKITNPLDKAEVQEVNEYLSEFIGRNESDVSISKIVQRLELLSRYKPAQCGNTIHDDLHGIACELTRMPVIRRIKVENLPLVLLESELKKRIIFQAGEPYDITNKKTVAKTLQAKNNINTFLQRNGYHYSNINIETKPIPGSPVIDLIITIIGGAFIKVQNVFVVGDPPVPKKKIEHIFKTMCLSLEHMLYAIGTGSFACYSKDKERVAIGKLQKLLDKAGYVQAIVTSKNLIVDPTSPETSRRCRATRKAIKEANKNGTMVSPRCVDLQVRIKPGKKLTTKVDYRDAQTIKLNWFSGFVRTLFGVEFFSRSLNSSPVGNKYPADETIITNQIDEAMTFSTSRFADESSMSESKENILIKLESRGYTDAKIDSYLSRHKDGELEVNFVIVPGEPKYIADINFIGNTEFTTQELTKKAELTIAKRSALHAGHLDHKKMNEEAQSITQAYVEKGYMDAMVIPITSFSTDNKIAITYYITKHKKCTVKTIKFTNDVPELTDMTMPKLTNNVGGPFVPSLLAQDENFIVNMYRDNGYLYSSVKSKIENTSDGAIITFNIIHPTSTPKPVILKGIIIEGNHKTMRSPILREMGSWNIKKNAPLKPQKMEDAITRLRQTRLFSPVKLRYPGLDQQEQELFAVVELAERPSVTFDLAFDFSTDYYFALTGQATNSNLFGSMLQLDTQLRFGLFIGQLTSFTNQLTWPRIYGLPFTFSLLVPGIIYEDRPNLESPSRHIQINVTPRLEWQATLQLIPYVQYSFRVDKWQIANYQPVNIIKDPKLSLTSADGISMVIFRPSSIRGIVEPGLNYTNLDNPFNPRWGVKLNLFTQYSGSEFGVEIPYTVFGGQISNYISLGPFTLATMFMGRYAIIDNPLQNWWILKYQSDLRTLGGDRRVRGYREDSIGVSGPNRNETDGGIITDRSTGDPVNTVNPGNLILQGSAEVRFPLVKKLFFGDLHGAIFTDIGAVTNCATDSPCFKENIDPTTGQDRQVGWSLGAGLRYVLPVGPLSLDYAVSLLHDAPGIFGKESRIHFMFGYAF